jgi:cell division septum initiation protein DivIVA
LEEELMMRDETSLREVEPELGAIDAYELPHDEPPFPLVIRGYDRRSVDDYLDATTARLAELEALQSPSVAVMQAVERVADDTGGILKTAHETAHGIVTRAREEADRTLTEARDEAERTIAGAEARARQIALDTDALWQERMRLIDDAHAVAASLAEIADVAAARFPAEEQDEAVEQPTESLDLTALWAAEDGATDTVAVDGPEFEPEAEALAETELEGEEMPDGLDDLEPPPEFR